MFPMHADKFHAQFGPQVRAYNAGSPKRNTSSGNQERRATMNMNMKMDMNMGAPNNTNSNASMQNGAVGGTGRENSKFRNFPTSTTSFTRNTNTNTDTRTRNQ